MKLRNAIQGYMLRCRSKGLTEKTNKWYTQKLGCFCDFMEQQQHVTDIEDITLWHMRTFVIAAQEGKTGAVTLRPRKSDKAADLTVKGYVQAIKGFFAWCVSEEILTKSPATRLENPKVASYVIATFEQSQIDALLNSCNLKTAVGYRDYAIILLLLDTGIRLSELRGLELADIHKDYVRVLGKGRKEREVGIHPTTAQRVWKYVNQFRKSHDENEKHVFLSRYGKPLTDSGISQAIADAGERAKIRGVRVSPHTFRHTFAITYLDNGGDVYKLSRLLGHSEIGTTEQYLKAFKSRQARKGQEQLSPIANLKQSKRKGKRTDDAMFD